jgi:hypothetical protein
MQQITIEGLCSAGWWLHEQQCQEAAKQPATLLPLPPRCLWRTDTDCHQPAAVLVGTPAAMVYHHPVNRNNNIGNNQELKHGTRRDEHCQPNWCCSPCSLLPAASPQQQQPEATQRILSTTRPCVASIHNDKNSSRHVPSSHRWFRRRRQRLPSSTLKPSCRPRRT